MIPLLSVPELLAQLRTLGESHAIEAKRAANEVGKSVLETISAFSNEPGLGGGYLLFGVSERGEAKYVASGVTDAKKLESDLATLCSNSFNRALRPRVWCEQVEGVTIVALFVPEAAPSEKPIFVASRGMAQGTFRRVGSTDQRCGEDDLRVLFQSSTQAPYEDSLVVDASLEDLDSEEIARYRTTLIEANPASELRDASFSELVQALGGVRRGKEALLPTVAGILLFGRRIGLRRLFPAVRIDYVRVPGTEWVSNPDRRYQSIEVRDPLLSAFRRVYNAIIDDLPKSFALEAGSPERLDQLALPESAVREVLVNALTHRDYRVANPILVIRYQDRIEVRNPGYSFVADEQLGQPGSFPRNARIADVFREMRLAENKGTGIAAIRRAMQRAGLTPPIFDSDRTRNIFIATLWLHNLIGAEDTAWLQGFASERLSDHQARALVIARRFGWVTNAMLRDLSGLDTLTVSNQLRHLRDRGLLDLRGKGSATQYFLGSKARLSIPGVTNSLGSETTEQAGQTGEVAGQTGGLELQTRGLGSPNPGVPSSEPALLRELPESLRTSVAELGGRPKPSKLRLVLVELCELRWWTPRELAALLGRKDPAHLSERHLAALVKSGHLKRRYPESIAHPQQAYRATQATLQSEEA